MKKCLTAVSVMCVLSMLACPVFAQHAQNQLNSYVISQLTDEEKEEIAALPEEELPELTEEEIKSILQEMTKSGTCQLPEVAQDVSDYITENATFAATGKLNPWEKKRAELYGYVQSSDWRTGKNISDADRAFRKTIGTIAFGLIKEAAQLCGYDRILDRIEQMAINRYENNQTIQSAAAVVAANISDATTNDEHTTNALYRTVQHNAFTLLTMSSVDYQKLVATYPEVEFLFDDMYTFFRWRYELRTTDPSYKLNENNIDVAFRLASRTNSFFAFWELANIAKAQVRNAIADNEEQLTTLTPDDERDSMKVFHVYAKQALYFGRIWNGMQRFAVKREALPKDLDPVRGAVKKSIKKDIRATFEPLEKDEILKILDTIRTNYAFARRVSEKFWNKWAAANLTAQKRRQMLEQLKELIEQTPRHPADSLSVRDLSEQSSQIQIDIDALMKDLLPPAEPEGTPDIQ